MGKPAVLYTAPRRKTPLDIHQIAALAGCSPSAAYDRINLGHPVAGHVWAKAGTRPAKHTPPATPRSPREEKNRVLLVADGDDTPRTYGELAKLAGFAHPRTVYIYVSKGTPICGRVYRRQGDEPTTRGQGGGRPCGLWRKNGAAAAAPSAPAAPEPRGAWRFGTSPEAYDLFPTRERAPVLDSGAIGGRGEM